MKNLKRNLIFSASMLILTVIISTTAVFAWFTSIRPVTDTEFGTGQFNATFELQYWNDNSAQQNKWTDIPVYGGAGEFFHYFGDLTDMSKLPENSAVYLKMNVSDTSGAKFIYDISLERININVYNALYQQISDPSVNSIDYYSLNQSCIESCYIESENSDLSPAQLTLPSESVWITEEEHSFSSGLFAAEGQYMYVKLMLRHQELLNIIRLIPPHYAPYKIEFMFEIKSEIRTVDYE
jgi:hypothetical protein